MDRMLVAWSLPSQLTIDVLIDLLGLAAHFGMLIVAAKSLALMRREDYRRELRLRYEYGFKATITEAGNALAFDLRQVAAVQLRGDVSLAAECTSAGSVDAGIR